MNDIQNRYLASTEYCHYYFMAGTVAVGLFKSEQAAQQAQHSIAQNTMCIWQTTLSYQPRLLFLTKNALKVIVGQGSPIVFWNQKPFTRKIHPIKHQQSGLYGNLATRENCL